MMGLKSMLCKDWFNALEAFLRTERLGARMIALKYPKACHLVAGLKILYLHGEEVRLVIKKYR